MSLVSSLARRETLGCRTVSLKRLRNELPAYRVSPVVVDADGSVLSSVLLGYSAEGESLLGYTLDDERCSAQRWLCASGRPLILEAECPLFVGAPFEDWTSLRITVHEAAGLLVFHPLSVLVGLGGRTQR